MQALALGAACPAASPAVQCALVSQAHANLGVGGDRFLSQPEDLFNVKVHVRCACGAVREFCVPTDRQIPGPLRCTLGPPGGGGGDGAIRCPAGHACGIGLSELRARVLKELEQGRGEHIRAGAVVIECQ